MCAMQAAVATGRIRGPERRKRILDAAAEGFATRGYHATSVGQIAEAAGITKPVIYDHFASKRDLFVALLEQAREELLALGVEAMRADAPTEERVRSAVEAFFSYVDAHPATARVLFTPPVGEPDLLTESQRVQADATAGIATLLAAEPGLFAGARDRRRRVEMLSEFFKQGMHGLAIWSMDHPGIPRRALVDTAMALVWIGLQAQLSPADADS
jgi:AcrR family transcriptional regulator